MRRTLACALAAFLTAAPLAACGGPAPESRPANSPAPHSTSPQELCITLVGYWADVMLKDGRGAGLDWEQKGLSTVQRDILDAVVAAGKAERSRHGEGAAEKTMDRQTERRCRADGDKQGSPADNGGTRGRNTP
ncbi:hypothetical protein [Streptomyces sp. NPDC047108]|uniref:hypothetical protein n=1 Tax=Streptomyces sp. NPDC047108 TaxID=3155025 RepID=UPI0033FBD042